MSSALMSCGIRRDYFLVLVFYLSKTLFPNSRLAPNIESGHCGRMGGPHIMVTFLGGKKRKKGPPVRPPKNAPVACGTN